MNNLKQTLTKKKYKIYTRPFELNIIGVRSANRTANAFDDAIHLWYNDDKDNEQCLSFSATTDPGTVWLTKPMNTKGAAILHAGQYQSAYQLGMHRRKYLALVQRGPVTVYRDDNRNSMMDPDERKTETGYFGINIHRAMQRGKTTFVDRYSAGCQVFQSAEDFALFMRLCEQHRKAYGNQFTYTLLEESR
jgi:hypothetical protein